MKLLDRLFGFHRHDDTAAQDEKARKEAEHRREIEDERNRLRRINDELELYKHR